MCNYNRALADAPAEPVGPPSESVRWETHCEGERIVLEGGVRIDAAGQQIVVCSLRVETQGNLRPQEIYGREGERSPSDDFDC